MARGVCPPLHPLLRFPLPPFLSLIPSRPWVSLNMLAASLVLLSVALSASATDYLVSSSARLSKRGLLEDGNYNISQPTGNKHVLQPV
jgi:hypothetical protein